MMMWKMRRMKDDLALQWRIRRIVWQSDIRSLLGGLRGARRGVNSGRPRMKVISVSGKNIVRIR